MKKKTIKGMKGAKGIKGVKGTKIKTGMFSAFTPKKKFSKKNVYVTPIINEGGDGTPADLKIKYGLKFSVDWDTFCNWMSSLFSRRK